MLTRRKRAPSVSAAWPNQVRLYQDRRRPGPKIAAVHRHSPLVNPLSTASLPIQRRGQDAGAPIGRASLQVRHALAPALCYCGHQGEMQWALEKSVRFLAFSPRAYWGPLIVLIISSSSAHTRKSLKITYGLCITFALVVCFLPAFSDGRYLDAAISAALAAAFLYWGYWRAARKVSKHPSA